MAGPAGSSSKSSYLLPHGAEELPTEFRRLDEQSEGIIEMQGNRPFLAKLPEAPKKILDVGCGTGVMTKLLAQLFPDAQVYGIDITTVPSTTPLPPNVTFLTGNIMDFRAQDNLCLGALKPGTFDYVFSRALFFGITDWAGLIKNVFDLLEPGGTYECQEFNDTIYDRNDHDLSEKWSYLIELRQEMISRGYDTSAGFHAKARFHQAGLQDVLEYTFRWALSSSPEWPESKRIGVYVSNTMPTFLPQMLRGIFKDKKTDEEIHELVENALESRKDIDGGDYGAHTKWCVVTGVKPVR